MCRSSGRVGALWFARQRYSSENVPARAEVSYEAAIRSGKPFAISYDFEIDGR
ncbi:MAG: hypothetical protein H7Y30_15480 [Pyrinomonadaceae bacterium]|nr:hypothetical protein [Pyrinomonadaceae bacterium]